MIELQDILRIGRRWWWLILLPVLGVGIYLGVTYRRPAPAYQVVMRFAAGTAPQGLSEDYDRYYAWLTSEYVANGLSDVARTGAFAAAVAQRLAQQGVAMDPGAIQGAITTDNAQSIVLVYLTGSDPQTLVPLAEAVSVELTENGSAYFPQIPEGGAAARRLDAPVPVPQSPGLRDQLMGPALRLMLAAGVGAVLAYLAELLVRRR